MKADDSRQFNFHGHIKKERKVFGAEDVEHKKKFISANFKTFNYYKDFR